jgi:phage/plasmid-associated DNA primase
MEDDSELAQKIAQNALALIKKQDAVARSVSPSYIYTTTDEKTGKSIARINYAEYSEFLKNHFHIIYFNKTMFIYDNHTHLYRQQTNEIETHIRTTCVESLVSGRLASHLLELKSHLTSMGSYSEYPFNTNSNSIPVDNGIVKIDYDTSEVSLLNHGPEHLFTYKLSITYDPQVRNCKAVALLKRIVEREYIKTLIQIPAQALLQMQTGHAYKKAYLLQGEAHAGKTTYLKLLYRMFGDGFTTAISLQQLCVDQFVGGNLEGKLLNIYDDLEDVALEVIDQFKTLTGDCRHGIERKYESKYTGRITAVHIFTCNYPPEYPEKVKRDTAFWARWEYIKCPYAYPVNPNFYIEWFTPEMLSSFFNLILAAMITIRKRGLLSNSDVQEVMMNWSVNSDPMYDFLGTIFEPNSTKNRYSFSKRKLYDQYLKWCNENGVPEHKRKANIKTFTIALQSHDLIPERKRESGDSYEVYSTSSLMQKMNVIGLDLDYHANLNFS